MIAREAGLTSFCLVNVSEDDDRKCSRLRPRHAVLVCTAGANGGGACAALYKAGGGWALTGQCCFEGEYLF